MKTLIVGLDNPEGNDPLKALWPLPEGTPGDRMRKLIEDSLNQEYAPGDFVLDFHCTNLYPTQRAPTGLGSAERDRDAFGALIFLADKLHVTEVVLLGIRLRDIFNTYYGNDIDYLQARVIPTSGIVKRFWSLPQPSVRNYWYNDEVNCADAGKLLARLRDRQYIPRRIHETGVCV